MDFPQSPRKGRTGGLQSFMISNLGTVRALLSLTEKALYSLEESVQCQEQQCAIELHSSGSRPPGSVEDGEEVDQTAGSPVIPALGIPMSNRGMRKILCNGLTSAYCTDTCHSCGELPDTRSLRKRLEVKLAREGLNISEDCANLLNNSIDVFMKRLMKPCLELTASRSGHKYLDQGPGSVMGGFHGMWPVRNVEKSSRSAHVSMLDLKVAMELKP